MKRHWRITGTFALLIFLVACGKREVPELPSSAMEANSRETITDTSSFSEDTGETDGIPGWWGIYEDQETWLGITNFDGRSFLFQLSSPDGERFNGAAPVTENNPWQAEYMDLLFQLDETEDRITVSMTEQQKDSGERECFTGIYLRRKEPEWDGTFHSQDGQTMEVKLLDHGNLRIIYHGYSEEGWYTDTYELEFSAGQNTDEAVRTKVEGVLEEEYYMLTEDGLMVRTEPAGAWKDGTYIREK